VFDTVQECIYNIYFLTSKSKSKSHYDRQSVGQFVLASGAHLGPATNFSFSLKFSFRQLRFVILWRPLWREDGFVIYCCCWTRQRSPARVCPLWREIGCLLWRLSVSVYSQSVCTWVFTLSVWHSSRMYVQYIQGLFQSRLGTADYALVTSSLHNNDSIVACTLLHMTAAKFKPLTFSVSGFALSNVANIFIFMILDDFCLLPTWFYYVIINVRHMKSLMHIANRCALRKIANGAENFILQSLQFQKVTFCRKVPGREPIFKVKVKVKVKLRLTIGQSVCLGVEFTLELVTRYYFLSEGCCVVSVGSPLWRWYINITITVLDIIHRPAFYLKHDFRRLAPVSNRQINSLWNCN
jgi:hypothetical protein